MPTHLPHNPDPNYGLRWWHKGFDERAARMRRWETARSCGRTSIVRQASFGFGGMMAIEMIGLWFGEGLPPFHTVIDAQVVMQHGWPFIAESVAMVGVLIGISLFHGRLMGHLMWHLGEWRYRRDCRKGHITTRG